MRKDPMKNWMIKTVIFSFFAFVFGLEDTLAQDSKSPIDFEKMGHNWGEVREGDRLKHTLKFKNKGKTPVQIKMIRPSCGCLHMNWSKEAIGPGETGYVEVEFNTEGKTGIQVKSAVVYFADDLEDITLIFSAEVEPLEPKE